MGDVGDDTEMGRSRVCMRCLCSVSVREKCGRSRLKRGNNACSGSMSSALTFNAAISKKKKRREEKNRWTKPLQISLLIFNY